jgi:hypothetical protein
VNARSAPKSIEDNLKFRKYVLNRCNADEVFREQIQIACSRSFVFWCCAFAWTYDPKTHPRQPNRPFVLYDYQEDGAAKILKAIGVEDRLIEKSRQMGVSWLLVAIFVWLWLYRPAQSFLLGSRKEDLVDKPGDPASLFWKLDYIIERLPWWMRPANDRTSKHLLNKNNNSSLDGESTNDNFGRGSTRTVIDLDEFQAVENGHRILDATQAATNCRLFVGTPNGASGAYYDQRTQMLASAPDRVLRFHWSMHPIYARGLYSIDGKRVKILDPSYTFPDDFDFFNVIYPQFTLRSPWFNEQCLRASNSQQIASELEIDYLQSGWQFFDPVRLQERIEEAKRTPVVASGELIKDPDNPDWQHPKWLNQGAGGRLKLWVPVPPDGKWDFDDVTIGCDISAGSGGEMTSNSAASIVRRSTGQKIGEIADNRINPTDFAYYSLMIAKWFNNAFLVWERNGPNGSQFTSVIKEAGYRNIFYPKKAARFDFVQSKTPGWWTDDENKPMLLGGYAEALWSGEFQNPSEEALKECGHYVQNGKKIEHDRSLAKATSDPTAIGESHGDRVIADSLAWWGMRDRGKYMEPEKPEVTPIGSAQWRRELRSQHADSNEWELAEAW